MSRACRLAALSSFPFRRSGRRCRRVRSWLTRQAAAFASFAAEAFTGRASVGALAGDDVEREKGDAIRDAEKELYMELIGEVRPLREARRLVEVLKERGHAVILASSAKSEEVGHYLDLLEVRELADGWTSSG